MKKIPQTILFLRLEGLVIFVLSIVAYRRADLVWWWFVAGLLVPDVSMAGYLLNNKAGALVYNAGHSLILPLPLAAFGFWSGSNGLLAVGLIWVAHIGMDRLFGYGLKEQKGFQHTHLGKIGHPR